MNTVKCERVEAGATKPMPTAISPTTASSQGLAPVPSSWPCPPDCFWLAAASAALLCVGAPGSGGAAGVGGAGGGHIILPSCRTMAPRTTSSSRSMFISGAPTLLSARMSPPSSVELSAEEPPMRTECPRSDTDRSATRRCTLRKAATTSTPFWMAGRCSQ